MMCSGVPCTQKFRSPPPRTLSHHRFSLGSLEYKTWQLFCLLGSFDFIFVHILVSLEMFTDLCQNSESNFLRWCDKLCVTLTGPFTFDSTLNEWSLCGQVYIQHLRNKQPDRPRKLLLAMKYKENSKFTKCFHGWGKYKEVPKWVDTACALFCGILQDRADFPCVENWPRGRFQWDRCVAGLCCVLVGMGKDILVYSYPRYLQGNTSKPKLVLTCGVGRLRSVYLVLLSGVGGWGGLQTIEIMRQKSSKANFGS